MSNYMYNGRSPRCSSTRHPGFLPRVALAATLFWSIPICCNAWGKEGHEIVGNIAYGRLTDRSRHVVDSILHRKDGNGNDDPLDMTPLAAIANWADKVRFTKDYHWSTGLHFVDIRDDKIAGGCPCTANPSVEATHIDSSTCKKAPSCWFVYERDCANDFCAVGGITNYTNRLVTHEVGRSNHIFSSTPALRASRIEHDTDDDWPAREALMFLTHFVGDIHQPLHSSRASDKGGNTIKVHFKHVPLNSSPVDRDGRFLHEGWNLHSVWDVAIIDRAITQVYNQSQLAFQQSVLDLVNEVEESGIIDVWLRCYDGRNRQCPSSWAEESFEDALRFAYSDEHGRDIVDGAELSDAYFDSRLHVVTRRLAAAGVRLAAVLEAALGGGEDGLNEESMMEA